jgi:NTP pyrophosphatase (non-canonical NTP hydrolase)
MTNTDPVTYISALKRLLMRIEEKHTEHGLSYRKMSAQTLIARTNLEVGELNQAWATLLIADERGHATRDQVRGVKEELLDVAIYCLLTLEQMERRAIFGDSPITQDRIDAMIF